MPDLFARSGRQTQGEQEWVPERERTDGSLKGGSGAGIGFSLMWIAPGCLMISLSG